MAKDAKTCQVVVRITEKLSKQIERAAKAKGLTNASWVRLLIIDTLLGADADQ